MGRPHYCARGGRELAVSWWAPSLHPCLLCPVHGALGIGEHTDRGWCTCWSHTREEPVDA